MTDFKNGDLLNKGKYRIEKELGNGAFGKEYLVIDKRNIRKAAKRIIPLNECDRNEIINTIMPEISCLIQHEHDNIVKYFDHFAMNDFLFVVIEYCEDGHLLDYLEKNNLNKNQILEWSNQIILGISYLHSQDCIHRDLRPQNILIKDQSLKLANFGLPKQFSNTASKLNSAADTSRLLYMAPERINDEEYSFPSDIWSLGIIFYQIITKTLPFKMTEIGSKQTPKLPNTFKDFDQILEGILEKEIEKRYNIDKIKEDWEKVSNFEGKSDADASVQKLKPKSPKTLMDSNFYEILIEHESGQYNKMVELIKKSNNINAQDDDGYTVLHVAARSGRIDDCRILIDRGSDVNSTENDGRSPLHFAALHGYTDICELLIDKGSDINAITNGGYNPLHWAARTGHTETCKKLIGRGSDINAINKNDRAKTPLHYAAFSGLTDICKLLIDKGSDITATTENGWTCLHAAAADGHIDTCQLLIDRDCDINAATKGGSTPLKLARNEETKELLTNNGGIL